LWEHRPHQCLSSLQSELPILDAPICAKITDLRPHHSTKGPWRHSLYVPRDSNEVKQRLRYIHRMYMTDSTTYYIVGMYIHMSTDVQLYHNQFIIIEGVSLSTTRTKTPYRHRRDCVQQSTRETLIHCVSCTHHRTENTTHHC